MLKKVYEDPVDSESDRGIMVEGSHNMLDNQNLDDLDDDDGDDSMDYEE